MWNVSWKSSPARHCCNIFWRSPPAAMPAYSPYMRTVFFIRIAASHRNPLFEYAIGSEPSNG